MPSANIVAASEPKEKQSSTAVGDINRKSDEWHLEYPHNKAFAALFYASVLKSVWKKTARYAWLLVRPSRNTDRSAFPASPAQRGI
jgi:hypothetical protein